MPNKVSPLSATMNPRVALAMTMPWRLAVDSDVCVDQLDPPFDVRRIVPLAPTAQPFEVSAKLSEKRLLPVPEVWVDHDVPL